MQYWVKRNLQTQQAIGNKTEKEVRKQLVNYYRRTMNGVIAAFESTYDKLQATIEEGREPTPADLYKLDRYWQMQAQLKEELQKLGDKQVALLSKQFTDEYKNVYDQLAIPGDDNFRTIDTAQANQAINSIWVADGKSWSQRIWENTDLLQQTLNDELIHCVVAGKKTSDLKKLLQERFGVSYNRADTLARTEIAHIQTQAAQKRYQDYGIQEVEVWADKDERRCERCGKLHQQRFPIDGTMPVPVHPRCRCTIIPVVE